MRVTGPAASAGEMPMNEQPLPSWNDGPAKRAIVDFVAASEREGSASYVPEADRIATFDNDGTLWCEQPAPVQTGLLLAKLVEQVKADPALAAEEPFKAIFTKDPVFLGALARQEPEAILAFLKGLGQAYEGTTPEEYEAEVRAFLAAGRNERFDRPFTDLVYVPMLELLEYLRTHRWRVFICSGGGRDFMRVFSEEVFGLPRENVIGSAPEYAYEDGRLVRQNALHGNLALGPGKPEHIYARTGRLPAFAAGNGDVDIEMLDVARFRLVITHDDADREYATTAGAERIQEVASARDWTTASMKEDWKLVFGES